MIPRFYAPEVVAAAGEVPLPEDEAVHLTRVLRLGAGARVRVFDGRGHEWEAEVTRADRGRASVRVGQAVAPSAEPAVAIALAVAVLKGDKMDEVVRDAVMLGASSIQPLVAERSEVSLAALARGGRVARWRRIAVASVKQCGRAVVPEIHEPRPVLDHVAVPAAGVRVMLVEPGATVDTRRLRDVSRSPAVEMLVGPEGGWTAAEIDAALASGAVPVRLGARTLRADAVPVVALTALQVAWDEF